jgi:hypothetical protein
MRSWPVSVAAMMLVALAIPTAAMSAVSAGVSITDEGLSGFYLAVGDYYEVPQERVVFVRNQHVPDEELPVVFFLSDRAHVGPDVLVLLRLGGMSWMEISLKYGITAEAFYVPVANTPGPPYGKAYGHYKNHDKSKWNEIRLSDPDIINFVNLKFVSSHYRCTPDEVIQARGAGKSFVNISSDIEKKRTVSEAPSGDKAKGSAKSGKDNSSGKSKK